MIRIGTSGRAVITATALISTTALAIPAAASSGAPARPAAATGKVLDIQLLSKSVPVVSSSGRKLAVSLDVTREFDGGGSADNYTATLSTRAGNESHGWSMAFKPGSANTISPAGKGRVRLTKSVLGKYGAVSITVKPHGKAKVSSCNGVPQNRTQPVTITGRLYVNTHSTGKHRWGSTGSKTKKLSFRGGEVDTLYDTGAAGLSCIATTPCHSSSFWTAEKGDTSLFATSVPGAKRGTLTASRDVKLSTPKHADREDSVIATTKPFAATADSANETSLSVTGTGAASGRASVASTTAGDPNTQSCKGGTGQESIDYWFSAAYTPGSPRLSAKEQVFGPISIKGSGATGQIILTTKGS